MPKKDRDWIDRSAGSAGNRVGAKFSLVVGHVG